jgi:hypothetical protein
MQSLCVITRVVRLSVHHPCYQRIVALCTPGSKCNVHCSEGSVRNRDHTSCATHSSGTCSGLCQGRPGSIQSSPGICITGAFKLQLGNFGGVNDQKDM